MNSKAFKFFAYTSVMEPSLKEQKELESLDHAHEIQQLFRYQYHDMWVDQSFVNSHSRLWVQTFHKLRKMGFIERKKAQMGYQYKWSAAYP